MVIEFLIRAPNGTRTEQRVCLPVHYAWQEGPHDLHVQFSPGDNFCSLMHDGDYVIPNPHGRGTVRAYHLGFRPEPGVRNAAYQRRIERLWPSPNRPHA